LFYLLFLFNYTNKKSRLWRDFLFVNYFLPGFAGAGTGFATGFAAGFVGSAMMNSSYQYYLYTFLIEMYQFLSCENI
jgi:hypothetical protein